MTPYFAQRYSTDSPLIQDANRHIPVSFQVSAPPTSRPSAYGLHQSQQREVMAYMQFSFTLGLVHIEVYGNRYTFCSPPR